MRVLPSFIVALTLLMPVVAQAYCGAKDPDESIAHCTDDIALLSPAPQTNALKLSSAHGRRAVAYENKNMMKEAWADYDQAVALLPSFTTYYNRGQFHAAYGDPNIAIDDLGEAIGRYERASQKGGMESSYEKALFHRAESLRRANRNAEAAADYTKAIALNPKDDLLLFSRALAWSRIGQHDAAIADLTLVLALRQSRRGGDQISALSNRGLAHMRKGDFPRALADMDEVVRREPDSVLAYVRRGTVLEQAGQREKAVADLRKAQSMAPSLKEVREGLTRLGVE